MADRDTRGAREEQAVDWRRWSYTQLGRMPPAWRTAIDTDPHLRDARVIVDLVFGRSRRVTVMGGLGAGEYQARQAKPFRVQSARDGSQVEIWPALLDEPVLEDQIDLSDAGVTAGPRKLQISLWGELVDPKSLIRAGWPVYGTAEVSLMLPGMDWEQRIVWMRGTITASSHAGRPELVTVTISDPVFQAPEVPPWVLDTTRFADIDESAIGERIPIVVNGGFRIPCPRVSAPVVGATNTFLAAAGHRYAVNAVFVNGTSVGATVYSFTETTDDLGLPVSVLEFPSSSGPGAWTEDRAAVYVRLTENSAVANGLIQTVKILMQRYGEGPRKKLSLRLFGEAEARLGQVGNVSGARQSPYVVLNAPTTIEGYVNDTLFGEYIMCALAWEEDGLGPIVVDSRATPLGDVTPGIYPALGRPMGVQYEWSPLGTLRNRFTMRYWYDAQEDIFKRVAVRSEDNSSLCAWSKDLVGGEQPQSDIDLITVTDDATANYLLDWRVEHSARPACDVTLEMYPEAWFMYRRGDPVRYTDPAVGFSNERALVIRRSWNKGRVELTFRVFPDLLNRTSGGSRSYQPVL